MREVEVSLNMKLVDAMTELRVWLDHNNYVSVSFDICKERHHRVIVRVVFAAPVWSIKRLLAAYPDRDSNRGERVLR
jgi:hypothetical protein